MQQLEAQRQQAEAQRKHWEQQKKIGDMVKAISDYFKAARDIEPEYQQEAMNACLAEIAVQAAIGTEDIIDDHPRNRIQALEPLQCSP